MNSKITIQEVNSLLSTRANLPKKTTEAFIRSFFEQISSTLSEEQYVKIKFFGTFKTIIVEERESINVNTGERINIDKHSKVSFTPDNFLKDLVNRPFSQFQSVILEDDTTTDELQKAEDSAKEIVQEYITPEAPEEVETFVAEKDENVATETNGELPPPPPPLPSAVYESPEPPQEDTVASAPEDSEPKNTPTETSTEKSEKKEPAPAYTEEPEKGEKKKFLKIAALVLGAILLFFLGYLCGKGLSSKNSKEKVSAPAAKVENVSETKSGQPTDNVSEKKETAESEKILETLPYAPVAKGPKGREMKITGYLGSYQLKKGDFLYRIASKVYGDSDMGRYIIQYNNISNPDIIAPGITIKLPKLEEAK